MRSAIFPLLAAVSILTSCVDQDSVYTLNGDGSGKVEHRMKIQKAGGNWTDEEPAKALALNLIRGAEGISAWDEVNYRMVGGDAVEARMTGYFREVNAVNLGRSVDAKGQETQIPLPRVIWVSSDGGSGTFMIRDSGPGEVNPSVDVTLNGTSVDGESEAEEAGAALGNIAMMKFAFDSSYRVEIRINGTVENAKGLEIADSGMAAVYEYHPKNAEEPSEEEKEKLQALLMDKERLGEGVHDNAALQKALFDREPPFTVEAKIEADSLDVATAISAAEFQVEDRVVQDKLNGWTKLESLEGK